mmetsp:Transcript_814/g.984  ORF Transcript_814/g.984 Transcript_814/m.984 type:complete len:200 (+) Transcript_814:664-1263(+)
MSNTRVIRIRLKLCVSLNEEKCSGPPRIYTTPPIVFRCLFVKPNGTLCCNDCSNILKKPPSGPFLPKTKNACCLSTTPVVSVPPHASSRNWPRSTPTDCPWPAKTTIPPPSTWPASTDVRSTSFGSCCMPTPTPPPKRTRSTSYPSIWLVRTAPRSASYRRSSRYIRRPSSRRTPRDTRPRSTPKPLLIHIHSLFWRNS